MKVMAIDAEPIEEGPLLAKYRIAYRLAGGRRYTVVLTLQHDEPHVTIDESFEGFLGSDEAYLQFDFKGIDPDLRQVMSNGGYDNAHDTVGFGYSGAMERKLDRAGKLPFELGLNTPNSLGVMRAAAFWRDDGPHALLLVCNRLRDWKTEKRHVWHAFGPGNLNFYSHDAKKYLLARLEGKERHWAMALIPREEMVNAPADTPIPEQRASRVAGPEVRLWQRLADFSLDRQKQWAFDFDESLGPISCCRQAKAARSRSN